MTALPSHVAIFVQAAGGIPDPLESLEQARRYNHEDLVDLADEELRAEGTAVSLALAIIVRDRRLTADRELGWFLERRSRIAVEMARRQLR